MEHQQTEPYYRQFIKRNKMARELLYSVDSNMYFNRIVAALRECKNEMDVVKVADNLFSGYSDSEYKKALNGTSTQIGIMRVFRFINKQPIQIKSVEPQPVVSPSKPVARVGNKYTMFYPNAGKSPRQICKEKKRFETEQEAYQKGQQVYKCKYCDGYHRSGKIGRLLAFVRRRSKGKSSLSH